MGSDGATGASPIRVALDVMGGDHGPPETVKGALVARESHNIELLLVGEGDVVQAELAKLGVETRAGEDWLEIDGRREGHTSAAISTYDDHRMAMSFAIAGLRVAGIEIEDPNCVSKSFPGFWGQWEKLT